MTNTKPAAAPPPLQQCWRGLGDWNFYFLAKFALLRAGYLNFHPMLSLMFLAFPLVPIPREELHRIRHWIAIPLGFALLWHDTWPPGPETFLSQGSQIAGSNASYIWDPIVRFINWSMIGTFFVLLALWLFISQWLRVVVFVSTMVVWLAISPLLPAFTLWPAGQPTTAAATTAPANTGANAAAGAAISPASSSIPPQTEPPTSADLTNWLNGFYAAEQRRKTPFPSQLPAGARPFDLLVINICSLSWSDIEAAGPMDRPLWRHFDIVFKSFNSATLYSGPAAVRLLCASCGQLSHTNLYQPSGVDCYLFENLAKLGFNRQLMLGHSDLFDNFLKELHSLDGMQSPLIGQTGLPVSLQALDGSPVYEDLAVLNRWLKAEEAGNNPWGATFYNTLPLHDSSHFPGQSKTADYKVRAQKLFDDLDSFFTELGKSGRKVMMVMVPEHDGALKGDKMQVSDLRDIPSPLTTNIPATVKFFGMRASHEGAPTTIDQSSGYLAVSELVVRALDGKISSEGNVNWQQYVTSLPQSAAVSENANAIVIQYQGRPYVQLNGDGWVPYPQ